MACMGVTTPFIWPPSPWESWIPGGTNTSTHMGHPVQILQNSANPLKWVDLRKYYILVPAQTDSTSKIYYATMNCSVKTTMPTQVSCMVNKNNLEPPGTRHRLHQPITGLLLHVDSWLSGSGNVLLSYSIIKFECIHFIFCDSNTADFILTLDWQVWTAIPPGQPMFQRFSTWGGPNTSIKFGPVGGPNTI